jgi:hypothetical protein
VRLPVPYAWTIDRSLPSDLFGWDEDDPPLFYSDELRPHLSSPSAVRSVGYDRETALPMDEIVWALDERLGATSRDVHNADALVWHAKNFELRVCMYGSILCFEAERAFAPEVQRLEYSLARSPLASVSPTLRAVGEVISATYRVWSSGGYDWSQISTLAEEERPRLLHALAVLGFAGTGTERTLRDQIVTIDEGIWSLRVETT